MLSLDDHFHIVKFYSDSTIVECVLEWWSNGCHFGNVDIFIWFQSIVGRVLSSILSSDEVNRVYTHFMSESGLLDLFLFLGNFHLMK